MAPAKNPWWQATKTPKGGFIIGGWWLLYAAYWIVDAITEPRWTAVMLAVLAPMLSLVYLASAVLLRRRQRSTEDSTWHGFGPSTDQYAAARPVMSGLHRPQQRPPKQAFPTSKPIRHASALPNGLLYRC